MIWEVGVEIHWLQATIYIIQQKLLLKPLALHIRKERFTNFEGFASKKTEMIDRD